MRNFIITLLALALTSFAMQAHPVDQETARRLGQSFVASTFERTRQDSDLNLVHIAFSERGEACYYIFNVGNTGFVIIAADNHYRPIIGYSDEDIFDIDNIAPALSDYLESVRQGVMEASQASSAEISVAADWAMLEKTGRMVSRHGGRDDEYLVETKWNQNYPYNYFCPEGEGGPGGHCYAGCVATAAAQLMKYWNHPIQGQGSYTYFPEDHPEYGPLTANFGETTYDWDNMPVSISANSSQAMIEAVALLIYHVGVSVDMNYRPTSSGAVTGQLCNTMPLYFYYTEHMANLYREDYTHEEYMQLIINAIDMNWPMVHRGGGHAYVLDGYNDSDMVHFNWGWGGSSDGWFNIDEHGYTDGESVIYNYVPAEIYAATPNTPTDINVIGATDGSLSAQVTWKNPVFTMTNDSLTAIDQIVVARNGYVVYTEDNVVPGAEMSIVDESVPHYDTYDYAIYAITNGQRGASGYFNRVLISPTCDWKIIMQSSAFQGWLGGYVSLYSASGREIQHFTTTNSTLQSVEFPVPVGTGSFGWTAPDNNINNITLIIKDSENNSVYTYQGSSSGLESGVFLEINNGCGNQPPVDIPFGLHAEMEGSNVVLTWDDGGAGAEYGHNIYRDDQLYGFSREERFVDEGIIEGHCYTVTILGAGGESEHSNETCASAGDCMAASNFDFEYVGDYYRIKLMWDRPEFNEGLSGYYLYRKDGEDGSYQRIKLLGASSTSYTDNSANQQGDYYYRLYAYYREIDCVSAPATTRDDPSKYYLKVYYSPTSVAETESDAINLFPNPTDYSLRIEAEGMTQVMVYNMHGQQIFESACEYNMLNVNVSGWIDGVYLIKVQTDEGVSLRRVIIAH